MILDYLVLYVLNLNLLEKFLVSHILIQFIYFNIYNAKYQFFIKNKSCRELKLLRYQHRATRATARNKHERE